ncbi:Transcriptional regulator, TetR family [Modestobacter italicus]|uniref:Transcriptional regulator, TetR family n=1 Tax=Modestobacter italicus (strain DSM 44449 / CECT 9708 / BC 501) TaxID=2732864 RepID=I4EQZ7_MODI5|nr:TetR/AcrR family transcriptional regulator [Modestobacter marinus]CCH85810.1 Transcriptional regulator, TetR family [Modestobacter marinus]
MTTVGGVAAKRPLRADAQRNRDAVLRAARETFETEGVLASLDGIALKAGVGNATLYRNFPTRDDLLAAVLESNVVDALAAADELSRSLSPRDALAEWLVHLTWQLRIWHDLPYCISVVTTDPDSPLSSARNPLLVRTEVLLEAARSAGDVRDDVTADELLELATALSWGVDRYRDDEPTARRRVAIATAGVFTWPPGRRFRGTACRVSQRPAWSTP